ncbi:MAG: PQQ-binding-like beta-propeller repeat protein, partial [Methanoregula sp.]|nr:PQQ-binding-like beta-propeller repeat protein [Methanoregula sp.]
YGIDHMVKVSPDGSRIVGISQSEVHSYTLAGLLTHTAALTTFSAPHTALLSLNGTFVIFNDGQAIRCVNSYNGTELWKGQVTGYVTSLSMNPAASAIIAGTETGNIAALNANGNLSWTYAANPEHRQASGITCTALSDNGATIAAGTADGRILFLNARGELTDSWTGKEYIRYIAMSSDGSTIVAASDHTIYAFTSGASSRPQPVTSTSPSGTTPAVQSVLTTVGTQVPVSTTLPMGTIPATITEIPTTWSVIPTATQSPPSLITLAGSFLLALLVLTKKG